MLQKWTPFAVLCCSIKILKKRIIVHYVSINTLLNVSKNGHFLTPPTQSFSWRNIGMIPTLPQLRKVSFEKFSLHCHKLTFNSKSTWQFLAKDGFSIRHRYCNWFLFYISEFVQPKPQFSSSPGKKYYRLFVMKMH